MEEGVETSDIPPQTTQQQRQGPSAFSVAFVVSNSDNNNDAEVGEPTAAELVGATSPLDKDNAV